MKYVSFLLTVFLLTVACAPSTSDTAVFPTVPPATETTGVFKEENEEAIDASTASPYEIRVAAITLATGEMEWLEEISVASYAQAANLVSPDGLREAKTVGEEIYITHSGEEHRLRIAGEQLFIAWLPDSTRFLMASTEADPGNWQAYELYLVSIGAEDEPELLVGNIANVAYVDLSPDSKTAVFTSNANSDHIDLYQLYTLDLASRTVTQLSDRQAAFPRWSPNGEWIAFSSWEASRDIFLIRPDGSELTRLTTSEADEWGPQWSADGESVQFLSEIRPELSEVEEGIEEIEKAPGCAEGGLSVHTPEDVRCYLAQFDDEFVRYISDDTAVLFTNSDGIADYVGGALIYHIPSVSALVLDFCGNYDPEFSSFQTAEAEIELHTILNDTELIEPIRAGVQNEWQRPCES